MSDRANALAEQFEKEISDLIQTIERCTDDQWKAKSGGEWTVAATAHHVGAQFPLEMEYLTASVKGGPLPSYSWDDINKLNDERAKANADCDKVTAIRQLRDGSAEVSAWLRGLSDADLDRMNALALADGAMVSTQQLIEGGVLIDHARAHHAIIRSST